MNGLEINALLAQRREWVKAHGRTFTGPAGDMRLEVGDRTYVTGELAGWTLREQKATPHALSAPSIRTYLHQYWMHEWGGTPNTALERRLNEVKAEHAAAEKYYREVIAKFGPRLHCHHARARNRFEGV
jgi:hypothetical protein